MNTNQLKKFAQAARTKLIEQVGAKLDYVLTHDTAELRGKANTLKKLNEAISKNGKANVIDKVAYTWFNRLVALRYMDANGYQPLGMAVITPANTTNSVSPELLDAAHGGSIPSDLNVDRKQILDLLDGRISSSNPDNEVFRKLLVAVCNQLHGIFPFLFERIDDYTELLLPNDLTSPFSIIKDVVDGMTNEDCAEVEVIGWLYQFYISERKDELINAKKVYKADEIAPVTQLFTPKWIVEYMVENTLGQYWREARPNTKIFNSLQFYIKPNNPELIPSRDVKSPEDIKFFDPCVGSAHVLCYAFDVFFKIYEEEGYDPSTIPELIISKNLYGVDIDDRASQLAGFALIMKGRKQSRRFFKKEIQLNITAFQNIESNPKFENAKVLGSLIKITKEEAEKINPDESSLFYERDLQLKKQAHLLSNKYDIIVTNPPYLNSGYMNSELKKYVEKEFKDTKSDLFACFIIQVSDLTKKDGFIGFICPYVWMFLQSYEKLREFIIRNNTISSLIQLEYNAFGPAAVPIGTFVLRNNKINNFNGSYIKLSEFTGEKNQAPRTIEAINDINCNWFYLFNQNNYDNIPGKPIAYWLSSKMVKSFELEKQMGDFSSPRQGMTTTDNFRFLKRWHEIDVINISFNGDTVNFNWFPHNKGGEVRKWFGNFSFIVNYAMNGQLLLDFVKAKYPKISDPEFIIKNRKFYFKECLTWTDLTTTILTARFVPNGFIFDASGPSAFAKKDINLDYLIAFLNSKIANFYSKVLNPTFHFTLGDFNNIPLVYNSNEIILSGAKSAISISKQEWDTHEFSWDFSRNELIHHKSQDIEEAYDLYQQYWKNKFFQLHKIEEELNKQFTEIYDLKDELTPDVPLEEITILKDETSIQNGQLVFHVDEVFAQFVSYAVGCMLGRYSLDKEGLILANQGETLKDYLVKVSRSKDQLTFIPDEDNVIPVLDDEWFEDDIVARFHAFLKGSFGEAQFQKNLAFVEECLGKDIRKYFVKDFYKDHIKRYKKRPIYWMFSSPKGYFNILIYMHRYTQDTLSTILNGYLREFIGKLELHRKQQEHLVVNGSPSEQNKAQKEIDKIDDRLTDCRKYESEILYPLAGERISIDLDDGVLVNYNKFGTAIAAVDGLNDKKTKKKVMEFDWIDTTLIR